MKLNDDNFWQWMDINEPTTSENENINSLINILENNKLSKEDLVLELSNNTIKQPPNSITKKLSTQVPIKYFLELQYCAKTYSTIFSKFIPTLANYIDELLYTEWILYLEPDNFKYRDHLVHMFKVAFAGDKFLSNKSFLKKVCDWQFESQHFKKWCDSKKIETSHLDIAKKEEIIRLSFFFSAIFHDFGYGYDFLRRYKERLFRLNRWMSVNSPIVDINEATSMYILASLPAFFIKENHSWLHENLEEKDSSKVNNIVTGFFRDCLPINHSVASALFILDFAEKFWDSGVLNQDLYLALQLAAEAVMLHDMTDQKRWAHFKRKDEASGHFLNNQSYKDIPLSILLIISDELAVWSRSRIEAVQKHESVKFDLVNVEIAPDEVRIEISNNEIEMQLAYTNGREDNSEKFLRKFKKNMEFLKGKDKALKFFDRSVVFI